MGRGRLIVFANRSGEYFANKLINELNKLRPEENLESGKIETMNFSNEESKVTIKETVRGADVYLVQSCYDPLSTRSINDNFFEMCCTIDALKRAGARYVTLVMPFHPYLRQDKMSEREPITARLAVEFIKVAGADAVITADMHTKQIEGFYHKVTSDNLTSQILFCKYIKERNQLESYVVLAPDAGATRTADEFAEMLKLDRVQVSKHRNYSIPNCVDEITLVGSVKNKNVLIFDDMIDTAGTIKKIIDEIKSKGAQKITICATHGLLTGPAIERLKDIDGEIIITDTIYRGPNFTKENPEYKIISIAPIFANAIDNLNKDSSVSKVYH